MPDNTPDNRDEQDQAHNPSQHDYEKKFEGGSTSKNLRNQEEQSASSGSGGSGSEDTSSTENVRQQEQSSGGGSSRDAGWTNNTTKEGGNRDRLNAVDAKWKRKKGPIAFIFALLAGGGAMAAFFSPGIALVQLKEVLLGDLNDQAAAMELRTDHILRAKLRTLDANFSICTNVVSIRCKFGTMSKRQVTKFKEAGFVIEPSEPDKRFGRTKVTSITFPENSDGSPGATVKTPQELKNHLNKNFDAISHIRAAFSPRFAGFWDAISSKVFAKFKTDKGKKVTGGNAEERDKSITSATAGEKAGLNENGFRTDENGRNYVIDDDGNKVYESGEGSDPGKFKELADREKANLASIADMASKSSATTKAVTGLWKGLSIAGYADTACSVYNGLRALSAAMKVTLVIQLVQFFMVYATTADRIYAGVATPEEVSHLGEKLTAVDTNETVVDEESVYAAGEGGEFVAEEHENPYYGMNAFDSAGYKTVAYNEAPTLTSRDMQYLIGGGFAGTMAGILDTIAKAVGGRDNIRGTCSKIQSWWARSIGLIGGIISGIGSFGTTTAITVGASAALGFAMPFIRATLADILTGHVVSGATDGVDAGDALFGGAAGLLGGLAMARGMKPAKASEIKAYMAATKETRDTYVAIQTREAQKTPWDINNQYSFLGSAVRKINPSLIKSTSSVAGAFTGITQILATGLSSIIPKANAALEFNPERYKKCSTDEGYRELGIDADVFCNVRYIMSDKQLAMDPLDTAEWMESNGHIEPDGTPKSDEYKEWITACTQRTDGWGETSNDDNVTDADIGKICMEVNEMHDNFAVFTMDKGIQEAMDEPPAGTSTEGADTPEEKKDDSEETGYFFDKSLQDTVITEEQFQPADQPKRFSGLVSDYVATLPEFPFIIKQSDANTTQTTLTKVTA